MAPVNTHGQIGHLPVLVLIAVWVLGFCQPGAAQDPVGDFRTCGPGSTFRVTCYMSSGGYLADVVYRNTVPPNDVALCNAPEQQLQQSQAQVLQLSAADSIIKLWVCRDAHGVRGLVLDTLLHKQLICGDVSSPKHCTPYSSGGLYPLGGFGGSCAAAAGGVPWRQQHTGTGSWPRSNPHHFPSGSNSLGNKGPAATLDYTDRNSWPQQRSSDMDYQPGSQLDNTGHFKAPFARVTNIINACWNPTPADSNTDCAPGTGSPGGGLPCAACPKGMFSTGGASPCIPCKAGTTTITPKQDSCGCFPGQGVYGVRYQDPEVCEECPAGTYSVGGELAPCTPCSNDAFTYLTSAPGSTSIADCTCAAGFGVTDANPQVCSVCPRNTYNTGPLPRAQQAAAAAVAAASAWRKARHSSLLTSSGTATAVAAAGVRHNSSRVLEGQGDDSRLRQEQQEAASTDTVGTAVLASTPDQEQQQLGLVDAAQEHGAVSLRRMLLASTQVPGASQGTPAGLNSSPSTYSQGSDAGVQVSAALAAIRPQQNSFWQGTGINPVFYQPTFMSCTPCGPACYTTGPGATSFLQCVCAYDLPSPSPSPRPSPSPTPSPSPAPLAPSPSPEPSPSPGGISPSPAPSPSPSPLPTCVALDTAQLAAAIPSTCVSQGSGVVMLIDYAEPVNGLNGTDPELKGIGFSTSPINILVNTDGIDCTVVQQNAGQSVNITINWQASEPLPNTCTLPYSYPMVLPGINGTIPEQANGQMPLIKDGRY